MWKTLDGFSAQISRFQHILPLSTAQINCSGSDLPFFRKPYRKLLANRDKGLVQQLDRSRLTRDLSLFVILSSMP
jgi:hypothetical protein